MIRGRLEKYLTALDCVTGPVKDNEMFSVRDKETLKVYAEISVVRQGHMYIFVPAYNIKDPVRRKALLFTLQEYADTPIEKR